MTTTEQAAPAATDLPDITTPLHLCAAEDDSRYAGTAVMLTGQHAVVTDGRRLVMRPVDGGAGLIPKSAMRRLFHANGEKRRNVIGWRRLDDGSVEIRYDSGARWTSPPGTWAPPPIRDVLPQPGAEFEFLCCIRASLLYEIAQATLGADIDTWGMCLWREKGKSAERSPVIVTSEPSGVSLLMPALLSTSSVSEQRERLGNAINRLHADAAMPPIKEPINA